MVGEMYTFAMSKAKKLEGYFNYAVWNVKMKVIMMKDKLWNVV
jgi:hypothetical protein